MTWMLTYTGRKVYPAELEPQDVDIRDIAHHLSMLCRFTGACRTFYSVAEHSLLVCRLLAEVSPDDDRLQLCGLLHDAPEAYLSDLATPLKRQLPLYGAMERAAWWAIAERFDLPMALPPAVKHADLVALAIERRDLMPPYPEQWSVLEGIRAPDKYTAIGLAPEVVKQAFIGGCEFLLGRVALRAARSAA